MTAASQKERSAKSAAKRAAKRAAEREYRRLPHGPEECRAAQQEIPL